jgi:hypothetical protein
MKLLIVCEVNLTLFKSGAWQAGLFGIGAGKVPQKPVMAQCLINEFKIYDSQL